MEREDDVQLIHAVLSGDNAAFDILVEKYQRSVHALAWRKIGDFHYALVEYRSGTPSSKSSEDA